MTDTDLKVISFYANKIHSNPAFYEAEKKRVVKYQVERYNSDDDFDELVAYIHLMTNDKYFPDNLENYILVDKIPFANICICGCDKCWDLYVVNHIPTNEKFAVGSKCIKKLLKHISYKINKSNKNEICIDCNEALYSRNCKNHIKNADKNHHNHCNNCWND
jgi:hypothetical protein